MKCPFQEEIFGPVIALYKFKTEEEVLTLANATRVGLAGYFFSNDVKQCWRVAKKMEVCSLCCSSGLVAFAKCLSHALQPLI